MPRKARCQKCGRDFLAVGNRKKFCSEECIEPHAKIEMGVCAHCSKGFKGSSRNPKQYCSKRCGHAAWKAKHRSPEAAAVRKARAEANRVAPHYRRHIKAGYRLVRRVSLKILRDLETMLCLWCSKRFVPKSKTQLRCSGLCSKLMHKAIYKARRRARIGAQVDGVNPYRVFTRDKWTCQECGIATPRKLRGLNLMQSPELGHIISFADHGPHTYENTRCECRQCNLMKGKESRGQLFLLG